MSILCPIPPESGGQYQRNIQLGAYFISEKQIQVSSAFDAIIKLEAKKIHY